MNEINSESFSIYGINITEESLKLRNINTIQLISEGSLNPKLLVKEDKHETIINGKENIINYIKNTFI